MTEKKTLEKFLKKLKNNNFEMNDKTNELLKILFKNGFNHRKKYKYTKKYFDEKYPKFPEEVRRFLQRVSQVCVHDTRDENKIEIKRGKFVLTYD